MYQQQCGKRNVMLELPNSCLFMQAVGWLPVREMLIRLCLMQPVFHLPTKYDMRTHLVK
jgi:hypothetical protein